MRRGLWPRFYCMGCGPLPWESSLDSAEPLRWHGFSRVSCIRRPPTTRRCLHWPPSYLRQLPPRRAWGPRGELHGWIQQAPCGWSNRVPHARWQELFHAPFHVRCVRAPGGSPARTHRPPATTLNCARGGILAAVVESASVAAQQSVRIPQPVPRNVAVDTYRGFVMLLMMGEVLELARVAAAYPGNWFWSFLAWNQTHVSWAGCSLHDTIQPGFSFLVGVALPYSIASRMAKGGAFGNLFLHALWRSFLLAAMGIFLRSMHSPQTYFTFEDTLTQIGLGYPVLFLLAWKPPKWQWIALGLLLFGYWLAWALYPAHQPGAFTGFLAHWNKGDNFGNAADVW